MSAQSRFVAILFVIGVTLISAVIYIRDMLVFDHGVEQVQACGQSIELGDSTLELQRKIYRAGGPCNTLFKMGTSSGGSHVSARYTPFHDNWHIEIEVTRGMVTAVRYGSRKHPNEHPKGAPPDRVGTR